MDLERVRKDLAEGRPWKALDRLQGMRSTAPADAEVLELLGRVRADMGDLPGAGLAWFLTDGEDPRRQEAFAAMRERHGRVPLHLIQALKPRAPVEAFPPGAQARLRELIEQLEAVGVRWDPARRGRDVVWREPARWQSVAGAGGCVLVLLVIVIPWLRGVLSFFG